MKRLLILFFSLILIVGTGILVSKCSGKSPSEYYVIARDPRWEPINLLEKDASFLAFSDELLAAIGNEKEIGIGTLSVKSSELFQGLIENAYDGILTSEIPSPHEYMRYILSDPYFLVGPVLIVNQSSTVTSMEQMQNKVVGFMRNSSVVFDIQKYPSTNLVPYDDATQALNSLVKKNIDGFIMDVLPAYSYTHTFFSGLLKIAAPPLTKKGVRLITKRNSRSEKLQNDFNEGLKQLKEDGQYNELIKRWDLVNTEKLNKELK